MMDFLEIVFVLILNIMSRIINNKIKEIWRENKIIFRIKIKIIRYFKIKINNKKLLIIILIKIIRRIMYQIFKVKFKMVKLTILKFYKNTHKISKLKRDKIYNLPNKYNKIYK
jgi:hypothetical protein